MKNNNKISMVLSAVLLTAPITGAIASASLTPKDVWIANVKQNAALPVCKGFFEDPSISGHLDKINMQYTDCMQVVGTISENCIEEHNNEIPAELTPKDAEVFGKIIGKCIGERFASEHLGLKKATGSDEKAMGQSNDGSQEESASEEEY